MTELVYGIYNITTSEKVILIDSKEHAHELCLLEKDYVYKPLIVAENVSEAKILIRNDCV